MFFYLVALGSCASQPEPDAPAALPLSSETDSSGPDTGSAVGVDTASADSGAPPAPVELLVDGSFEAGADDWSVWGGAGRIQDPVQDGAWALRATAISGAEQRVTGLKPATVYRLSGWAQTSDGEPITIGVKDHGNPEDRVAFSGSGYVRQSMTFATGAGSTAATVYAYKHSGEGAGHADGLSLVEEGPAPYELVWSDEFDGSGAPDPSRWGYEEGFVRNEELQWYQPENATLEGGHLVIEGRRESRENPGYVSGSADWRASRPTIDYTAASVTTAGKAAWQYGRIVVRAKVTNHVGTWPAIWTLGVDCDWPSNGEVDIMENYGGNLLANFAWGTDTAWSPRWDSSRHPVSALGDQWTEDFHTWELAWTEAAMAIYLDGKLLNEVDLTQTINGAAACAGQNPFQQPHYLLLNLALGANGGSVEGLEFPTEYRVDYVRVYQEL